MPFISECLEIAPACEERMLGREGLPLLGEAGVFLTGLSTIREHYLIRRNRPEFHILMVSHDEGGALLTDGGEQPIPAGALVFLPAAVPGGLRLVGKPGIPAGSCWTTCRAGSICTGLAIASGRGRRGSSSTICSA